MSKRKKGRSSTSHLWCPKGCGKSVVYTSDIVHDDQDTNMKRFNDGRFYVCTRCGFTANKKNKVK